MAINLSFLDQSHYFFFQVASYKAEWTSFQAHYYSENVVALVFKLRTSGSVTRNSDH
jgi:hypothetical protein